MGPGRHFVHYPVACGRVLNFVGLIEQDAWETESWTEPGDRPYWRAAYQGWHPQVPAIIAAAEQTFKWALLDRMPLPRWSFGRVTLLGDACHPMLPFSARAPRRQSRMAPALTTCLPRAATTSKQRSSSTKRCGCRAPRGSSRSRGTTRIGSTCPTGRPSRSAMPDGDGNHRLVRAIDRLALRPRRCRLPESAATARDGPGP